MRIVFSILIMIFISLAQVNFAYGQTEALWQKVDAFSRAENDDNIYHAADLAAELANIDFTKEGFTYHEAGELRVGFVEALVRAKRYDHAAALLNAIATGDRAAFLGAQTPEEKSFYRQTLIERLERVVDIEEMRGNGNRLIDALEMIYQLKREQLGETNLDLEPVLARLVAHAQRRAQIFADAGRAEDAMEHLLTVQQYAEDVYGRAGPLSYEVRSSIVSITIQAARQADAAQEGNKAIELLKKSWVELDYHVARNPNTNELELKPLSDQLYVRYLRRFEYYRSQNMYVEAVSDLKKALGLLRFHAYTLETLPRASDPWNSDFENADPDLVFEAKATERKLARSLLDWARALAASGQHKLAFEKASEAQSFHPNTNDSLGAEIAAFRIRSYRDWKSIPADRFVELPPLPEPLIGPWHSRMAGGPYGYGAVRAVQRSADFTTVRVFYGTNRTPRRGKYTSKVSDTIEYGWTQITVPKKRDPGEITRPGFFQAPRDHLHFIIQKTTPYLGKTEFSRRLGESLKCSDFEFYTDAAEPKCLRQSSKPSEMFIFIHGHNVDFDAAAMQSAQLAVDLYMENGAVFYAWPTGKHALDYWKSRRQADQSYLKLVEFLETVINDSNADRIHLIAHSMGNRILMNALQELKTNPPPGRPPFFNHVIFASPDVDQSKFAAGARTVESLTQAMTLYGSDKDKALKLSSEVNNERRAGLSPPDPAIINATEKLVYIDTSKLKRNFRDLIDHADFTAGAFNDVRGVLWTGANPFNRCVLERTFLKPARDGSLGRLGNRTYWLVKSVTPSCDMKSYGERLVANRKQAQNRATVAAIP